jgi:hypothetical protein
LRHLWVLLPGFPLHLWNEKALEAIANSLSLFIKVDKQALVASYNKLEKVLVELDIHTGLMESLDIVWRGHYIYQKLDYLGIPFRFSFCRKTDHLRRHCPGFAKEEKSEDTMLNFSTRVDSPGVDSRVLNTYFPKAQGANDSDCSYIVTGKLKTIFPSLFFSLSSWERETLDSSSLLGAGFPILPSVDKTQAREGTCPPISTLFDSVRGGTG